MARSETTGLGLSDLTWRAKIRVEVGPNTYQYTSVHVKAPTYNTARLILIGQYGRGNVRDIVRFN